MICIALPRFIDLGCKCSLFYQRGNKQQTVITELNKNNANWEKITKIGVALGVPV